MSWLDGMNRKERRGSRPRCVLLTRGARADVARRLTALIAMPDVAVSPDMATMPRGKPVRANGRWDRAPVEEAKLERASALIPSAEIRRALKDWWLAVQRPSTQTPNWDIAAACTIRGRRGLMLAEAKAHTDELSDAGKSFGAKSNVPNHERIARAIGEANAAFSKATGTAWNLSRDRNYQLSNRFAWCWKLASLGVPVVLVYLGFLNADEMDKPFQSLGEWESALKSHAGDTVDNAIWERGTVFRGTPFIPVIRACEQPLDARRI